MFSFFRCSAIISLLFLSACIGSPFTERLDALYAEDSGEEGGLADGGSPAWEAGSEAEASTPDAARRPDAGGLEGGPQDARAEASDARPDAPDGELEAGCAPSDAGPYTCGGKAINAPGEFCVLAGTAATATPAPEACRCGGTYGCACLLRELTPEQLCAGQNGTYQACSDVDGPVVRCGS